VNDDVVDDLIEKVMLDDSTADARREEPIAETSAVASRKNSNTLFPLRVF
jgi:hypothetical protein